MVSKKIGLLARIMQDQKIQKMAQDTGSNIEGEIDQATADQLAQDIFDKLFDEELKKAINQD